MNAYAPPIKGPKTGPTKTLAEKMLIATARCSTAHRSLMTPPEFVRGEAENTADKKRVIRRV
jgi:hypothetical protein